MSGHKLVMGHIEVMGPDGESGIPYDQAVIHVEDDEDAEIDVRCLGALRLASKIVRAVNAHDDLVEALTEARLQVEYMQEKFQSTSTGVAVLTRIDAALTKAKEQT